MSDTQQLGPDRCAMEKRIPGKREHLARFARGSTYIRSLLQNGWTIVEDPRNHIKGDYSDLIHGGGQDTDSATAKEDPKKQPALTIPIKRKPGRPRKTAA